MPSHYQIVLALAVSLGGFPGQVQGFSPCQTWNIRPSSTSLDYSLRNNDNESNNLPHNQDLVTKTTTALASFGLAATLAATSVFGVLPSSPAFAGDEAKYDGFAEYAKENQMQQSDVGCFVKQCGDQTKALFANPRGIKGVTCLGRCKGEQSCATRCFAEFGSEALNDWLSCTIEENECVKVPKNVDNSAEDVGFSYAIKSFDPTTLVGTWYKTDGLVSRRKLHIPTLLGS